MIKTLYIICFILIISGCTPSNKCKSFFSYENKTLDIKGLQKKINNKEEFNVGSIIIKKEAIEVSDRLKELDMLQFYLCSQIKTFNGTNEEKNKLVVQVTESIIEMLRIAQNPDSLISHRISSLERSEAIRSTNELKEKEAKLVPPDLNVSLVLDGSKNLQIRVAFINNIPIKIDNMYVNRYRSDLSATNSVFYDLHTLYPKKDGGDYIISLQTNIGQWSLSKNSPSRITLHFNYESIHFVETRDPLLYKKVLKSYLVDPLNNTILEIAN